MAQHNQLGKEGEKRALEYLISKGYRIRDVNWRFEKCELDLVCEFAHFIVVVEVKTRSNLDFGKPADFVTSAKQAKLIEGAEAYLEQMKLENELRFDIIEVIYRNNDFEIQHIENAFHDGL